MKKNSLLETYIDLRNQSDELKAELNSIKQNVIKELELLDDKYCNDEVELSLRRTHSYEYPKEVIDQEDTINLQLNKIKAKQKQLSTLKKHFVNIKEAKVIGTRVDVVMHK